MLLFRDHTYNSFVFTLVGMIKNARKDEDKHALTTPLRIADRRGLWLEFGVYGGSTLSTIARKAVNKTVYAFDSFKGLPEEWRGADRKRMAKYVRRRAFDRKGVPPSLAERNVAFIVGWFNETLPSFVSEHADRKVSLLHVDSDLYSSAHYVLRTLSPFLHNGSVVVFDELVNYPQYREGELKALWDVFGNTGHAIDVVSHSCRTVSMHPRSDVWPQAVAVRIVTPP